MFNMMLDYAVEHEIVSQNCSRSFNISSDIKKEEKTVEKEHIPFTEEELQLLWDNVYNIPYMDILLIQCYSGWRPQELGLIELENVDIENWTFEGGMKSRAGIGRIVPIHTKIRPLVLKRYEEARSLGSKYLFNSTEDVSSQSRMLLTYSRYYKCFVKIKSMLPLDPEHRPHDGRIHFVTMAKEAKVDEYAIKYIVGHAIADLTERVYTKRNIDWLKEEIEKIK